MSAASGLSHVTVAQEAFAGWERGRDAVGAAGRGGPPFSGLLSPASPRGQPAEMGFAQRCVVGLGATAACSAGSLSLDGPHPYSGGSAQRLEVTSRL